MISGTTAKRSPTIPKSATSKIGASGSLLIATIVSADEHPAKRSQIHEMVYKNSFDMLIELRKMLWEKLPSPESVLEFLDKKSKEKKDS
jgi:hypothetical protein